ncbi:transcriptional repressor [Malaciobacter canalis]|jgi:Fur family peroxide stress response transcriptional regulator|uniref:Transcriptional repressor n=1 Tax=Malaciobacter canalis TaxID=1912871 RepID=A0ABX4LTG3_9BACT|nr:MULTISPECIES: transcriptional repressor [Malaciobacter]PHO11197.1 transcriptional repressor [Malaciobacter canalis]QEE33287.1 peroxide stress transcriptional regulator PerR [Malaciobacter canalis]SKB31830.1 Fur family transcriptional regulator, peroxide stress response regulator [Malaciobacter marinus]
MINYTTLLKEYDLKVTPQRVAIVEELYSNGHMNIDDLYKKLLEKFPSISLATIYKNINAMIEKVFLNEVKIPNAKSVYELVKDEHSHLVCSSCGKIEDVDLDISNLVQEATSSKNYTINQASIIFAGVCPDCSK